MRISDELALTDNFPGQPRCTWVVALPDSTRWIHLAMDIDEWVNALMSSDSYDITMQSTLTMTMDDDPRIDFCLVLTAFNIGIFGKKWPSHHPHHLIIIIILKRKYFSWKIFYNRFSKKICWRHHEMTQRVESCRAYTHMHRFAYANGDQEETTTKAVIERES